MTLNKTVSSVAGNRIAQKPDGAFMQYSGKNLLDNPDFGVNQYGLLTKGSQVSAVTGYRIDRWAVYGAVAKTMGLTSDGHYKEIFTASGSGWGYIGQDVDNFEKYAGKTVTLSAKVKSNAGVMLSIYDGVAYHLSGAHSGGGEFEILTVTAELDDSLTRLFTQIGYPNDQVRAVTSGDYYEVEWVKLELGDTATDFEPPNHAEQMNICQRYYRVFGRGATVVCQSATKFTMAMDSSQMVGTPALVVKDTAPTVRATNGGRNITSVVTDSFFVDAYGAYIQFACDTIPAGWSVGQTGTIISAGVFAVLDANL